MQSQNVPGTQDASAQDSKSFTYDFLQLPNGGSSDTVYVDNFTDNGQKIGGFAKKPNGTFHTRGIKWKFDSKDKTDLNVTFHLQGDVVSLSAAAGADIQFSTVVDGQQTATFPAKSENQSFNVNFSDGSHDPQIIITPA